MENTHHALARMSMRGISKAEVLLVNDLGRSSGDRVVLGKKEISAWLHDLDRLKGDLHRLKGLTRGRAERREAA